MYLLHVGLDSVQVLSALDIHVPWQVYHHLTDFHPCSHSVHTVLWMDRHWEGHEFYIRKIHCTITHVALTKTEVHLGPLLGGISCLQMNTHWIVISKSLEVHFRYVHVSFCVQCQYVHVYHLNLRWHQLCLSQLSLGEVQVLKRTLSHNLYVDGHSVRLWQLVSQLSLSENVVQGEP